MKNLRQFLDWNDEYYMVCREERNVAAVFYQLLACRSNLNRFLEVINYDYKVNKTEGYSVYFEYAYLRDLWHGIAERTICSNEAKKEFILGSLKLSNDTQLRGEPVGDFNSWFIQTKPSTDVIQSPSNWNLSRYAERFENVDDFEKISWFKWAFNAKPDIVIHLTDKRALCIEAKLESPEDSYPGGTDEKREWDLRTKKKYGSGVEDRSTFRIRQTCVQSFLMSGLLGMNTAFVFLSRSKKQTDKQIGTEGPHLQWRKVFGIQTSDLLEHSNEWIARRSWDDVFNNMATHDSQRYLKEIIKRSLTESDS